MSRLVKLYFTDAVINMAAQIFLLAAGCIALVFWIPGVVSWGLIVICYSVALAHGCEKSIKRGASFMNYLVYVMLPANISAAAVSCVILTAFFSVPSQRTLVAPAAYGFVIWAGSVAITVISVFYNRVVMHSDRQA